MRLLLLAAVALAGFLYGGCGGNDASGSPAATVPDAVFADEVGPTRLVVNTYGPGPPVPIPKGPPPRHKIVIVDLREGSGREAKVGNDVTVRYVGVHWDGSPQTNTWAYATAPVFELGTVEASERGLDEAIRGMKVGGRREIIIPGSRRAYPKIDVTVKAAVVYVVDLLAVGPAAS